jgi:hypothetical protein
MHQKMPKIASFTDMLGISWIIFFQQSHYFIKLGKKSELVILDAEKRTAQNFVDQVYEGTLKRFLEQFDGALLMEDWAPIHRSKIAKEWRDSHGVEKIAWPSYCCPTNVGK